MCVNVHGGVVSRLVHSIPGTGFPYCTWRNGKFSGGRSSKLLQKTEGEGPSVCQSAFPMIIHKFITWDIKNKENVWNIYRLVFVCVYLCVCVCVPPHSTGVQCIFQFKAWAQCSHMTSARTHTTKQTIWRRRWRKRTTAVTGGWRHQLHSHTNTHRETLHSHMSQI